MKRKFVDIKNNFDFYLRNLIHISRKNYSEKKIDSCLFEVAELQSRIQFLIETYDFSKYSPDLNFINFMQNMYYLDIFDRYFDSSKKEKISALDIGAKNWFYAPAQASYIVSLSNAFSVDGIELDANRLNTSLFSRKELAKYYSSKIQNANFLHKNLLEHNQKYDFIFWILPFVFFEPHQVWGLPMSKFTPEKLLAHAFSLLENNGEMFIINQGWDECLEQQRLCKTLEIPYKVLGEISSPFFDYSKRYLIKIMPTQP